MEFEAKVKWRSTNIDSQIINKIQQESIMARSLHAPNKKHWNKYTESVGRTRRN